MFHHVRHCTAVLSASSVALLAQCDAIAPPIPSPQPQQVAAAEPADWCTPAQRAALRAELAKVRRGEAAMYARWEADEVGWRKLPPRAWPARQPGAEEIPVIRAGLAEAHCPELAEAAAAAGKGAHGSSSSGGGGGGGKASLLPSLPVKCRDLEFDLATALVFNNVDGAAGLTKYGALATAPHCDVESVVALGVCLVEGLACEQDEGTGVSHLKRAVALGSAQACYELGILQYMGTCGAVTEDEAAAYLNFEKAAAMGHAGALFMTADCLIEGTGVQELDPARAVSMLMAAAEQGHRFARQRLRELIAADKERDTR